VSIKSWNIFKILLWSYCSSQ